MKFLNLIPLIQKIKIERERRFLLLHGVIGILVFVVAINAILLTLARFLLVKHYNDLKNNTKLVNTSVMRLQNDITKVNRQVEIAGKIQSDFIKTSDILQKISALIPETITINYLHMETENLSFKISGISPGRQGLLETKNALENAEFIKTIDSPLSNFLEKSNIEFKFNGKIEKSAFTGK